jgi:putative inorganic carbon (HCO3(-)) transporter
MNTGSGIPFTLATAHGLGGVAERVGVLAAVLLTALAVLGRPPRVTERARAVALLAILLLTPVLLVIDIWDTSQLRHLRHHPALAGVAIVAGLAVLLALAVLITRRPEVFPLLAVFALPFRLPISTGGTTSNLLIPLYVVVGAGTLAHLVPRLLGRGALVPSEEGPDEPLVPVGERQSTRAQGFTKAAQDMKRLLGWMAKPRSLEWLLMASIVLYGLQATYSADFSKALENVVFFYVPFALLFALLRATPWTRGLLLRCFGVAVALAVVFVGVGFIEYHRHELLLNPKVVAANQYDNYFRVNSLFFDPSIYGRFLALVMLGATTGVLWTRRRRDVLIGAVVLLWLWGGLITSFSQSSIAALLLGLAVLAAWRWDVRGTVYVSIALAAIAAVVVIVAPTSLHIGLKGSGGSANNATSGRTNLVTKGLELFVDRPLQGFGPGSFPLEYRQHNKVSSESATSASHTIPVTVAAEQGIVGLLLYVALLISAFAVLFTGAGRAPPGGKTDVPGEASRLGEARWSSSCWRIAIAACFAALVLHTWTYADFLEDPLTWTLLGIGTALALSTSERTADREPAVVPMSV